MRKTLSLDEYCKQFASGNMDTMDLSNYADKVYHWLNQNGLMKAYEYWKWKHSLDPDLYHRLRLDCLHMTGNGYSETFASYMLGLYYYIKRGEQLENVQN